MIRVDVLETFPITVSLVDESTGALVSGETVTYDIRDSSDASLSPPINGTLTESTVTSGIYKIFTNIPTSGDYILYTNATGYAANTEDIIVNPEKIYDLIKQTFHYNTSVQDVIRLNDTPTASQTTRNVPLNKTDYIITKIKNNSDIDWSSADTGIVYAWYTSITDTVPYKMSDSGV